MAFRSSNPVMLTLPPFRGVTRRLILIALMVYFGDLVLGLVAHEIEALLADHLFLHPDQALHGLIWEFVSYPFLGNGLIGLLLALLTVWFFGATLEDERGPRWLVEYFLTATIVGGVIASLLAVLFANHVPYLAPPVRTGGLWPFVLALVLAFASFHPNQSLRFNFILTLKAKHLAAIYLLLYLAGTLLGHDSFGTLTVLCNALAGYIYLRLVPRRGLRTAVSERWFAMRNEFYRAKRRRAAKKFTVYMRKQGKEVSLDSEGRYIDPDGKPRDPNDRNWMN
jgi:membrane associated rhomboid family serine protease